MQAIADKISGDKLRIKSLVEAAAERCGGFKQLADKMDAHPQLISNWRNGVKTPSPEAQAEMAQIAGQNPLIAGLMAMIEKSTGPRRERLQAAYRDWMHAAGRIREL